MRSHANRISLLPLRLRPKFRSRSASCAVGKRRRQRAEEMLPLLRGPVRDDERLRRRSLAERSRLLRGPIEGFRARHRRVVGQPRLVEPIVEPDRTFERGVALDQIGADIGRERGGHDRLEGVAVEHTTADRRSNRSRPTVFFERASATRRPCRRGCPWRRRPDRGRRARCAGCVSGDVGAPSRLISSSRSCRPSAASIAARSGP